MILAEVNIGWWSDEQGARKAQDEIVAEYLGLLGKNGQIVSLHTYSRIRGRCIGHVCVARPDSLEDRYHSGWGHAALNRVKEAFSVSPVWTVLEDTTADAEETLEGAGSLIFFTHFLDEHSPIIRGDNGLPVARYLLPVSDSDREGIGAWAWAYRAHDAVSFSSGELEVPAYKQLVEPESGLSRTGRQLAFDVEQATDLPTYYYLMRYWGRRSGEESRRCPGCGYNWRHSVAEMERGLLRFAFRCDACRLVSDDASTDDDERHARLGEYRPRRVVSKIKSGSSVQG